MNRIARILYIAEKLDQEYMGEHTAPTKNYGTPIHNVEEVYPDLYERGGSEYVVMPEDREGLSIILQAHNRPNFRVKVYRAIPKIESPQEIINNLEKEYAHIMKKGKPSGKLEINHVDKEKARKKIEKIYGSADENSVVLQYIEDKIEELKSQKTNTEKIKIERGNWVSPSKNYAKMHGLAALKGKYRIVSKTVKAKDLFTDGNSLSEWGYDPQ
jgi:hypothetical protein